MHASCTAGRDGRAKADRKIGRAGQRETLSQSGNAIWDVWPRPAFTLIPVTPRRLAEKRAVGDHFFETVLKEGVLLAQED